MRTLRIIDAVFALCLLAPATTVPCWAQQTAVKPEVQMEAGAHPAFAVVTIKPSDPNATNGGFPLRGHRVSCFNVSLLDIFSLAYDIHPKQIVNAPEWFTRVHYDVEGVPDVPGQPNLDQIREMYKGLLADRFRVRFHHATQPLSIYSLVITSGGPKLTPARPDESLNAGSKGRGAERTLVFRNMSIQNFILNMNHWVDRPIIDHTSLTGGYDFTLSWTADTALPSSDASPSLFTAIKEQLGLELKAVRQPSDVVVIDNAEQPGPN